MTRCVAIALVLTGLAATPAVHAQPRPDVDVQTSLSRTALWLGDVVTYRVSLTCRRGVEVLQEDLGADRLILDGLQVVGHTIDRRVADDGTTRYDVAYRLTTFEPGAETRAIGDWTARYAVTGTTGARAAARDLRIPGAALAWRSALPPVLKSTDLRAVRRLDAAPQWWAETRAAGIGSIAVGASVMAWLLISGRAMRLIRRPRRRTNRVSQREIQNVLRELRDADLASPAHRLAAYGTLEAAIRRHAAEATSLPALALTPAELRQRADANGGSVPADEVERLLSECQQARYQPIDRLPPTDHFVAALDAFDALLAQRR